MSCGNIVPSTQRSFFLYMRNQGQAGQGSCAARQTCFGHGQPESHRQRLAGMARPTSWASLTDVHTCPGSDRNSAHSAEIDDAQLLPSLFELKVGSFYIALAGVPDRCACSRSFASNSSPACASSSGSSRRSIRTSRRRKKCATACSRRRSTSRCPQLGSTDDYGFSRCCDDTSTTRDTALSKIWARIDGTAMAAEILGGRP